LEGKGITADARGRWLRLSPDYLATDDALRDAAAGVADLMA
jgi:hypothetical protein